MSYAGLVPKGNSQIRRSIVEVCWSYRHRPSLKGELLKRQEGQDPEAKRIARKAQHRLHMKYHRISAKGKGGKVAVVDVVKTTSFPVTTPPHFDSTADNLLNLAPHLSLSEQLYHLSTLVCPY